LDLGACPVKVTENNRLFWPFGRRYFDRSLDNLGNFNGPVYDLFDTINLGHFDLLFNDLGDLNWPVNPQRWVVSTLQTKQVPPASCWIAGQHRPLE
jgi:hypothetical protein